MRKKGWFLLLVLLCVAFLMSCSKETEPDEAKGELVRIEREGCQMGTLLFLSGNGHLNLLDESFAK